jgi:hypothetical protein
MMVMAIATPITIFSTVLNSIRSSVLSCGAIVVSMRVVDSSRTSFVMGVGSRGGSVDDAAILTGGSVDGENGALVWGIMTVCGVMVGDGIMIGCGESVSMGTKGILYRAILFFASLCEWCSSGIVELLSQVGISVPTLLGGFRLGFVHPSTILSFDKVVNGQSGSGGIGSTSNHISTLSNLFLHHGCGGYTMKRLFFHELESESESRTIEYSDSVRDVVRDSSSSAGGEYDGSHSLDSSLHGSVSGRGIAGG